MFGMPVWLIVALGGAAIAYLGAGFVFKRDEAKEDRRRKSIKMSEFCAQNGLDFLCPVLTDYAVGDYSSLLHRLRQLTETIENPVAVATALNSVVTKQLELKAGTAEGKEQLAAMLSNLLNVDITED